MKSELHHLEADLKKVIAAKRFSEKDHLDPFDLAAFEEDLLNEQEADVVRLHLAYCDQCRRDQASVRASIQDESKPTNGESNIVALPKKKPWPLILAAAAGFFAAFLLPFFKSGPEVMVTAATELYSVESEFLRSDENTLLVNSPVLTLDPKAADLDLLLHLPPLSAEARMVQVILAVREEKGTATEYNAVISRDYELPPRSGPIWFQLRRVTLETGIYRVSVEGDNMPSLKYLFSVKTEQRNPPR